jgi:hypothetical protein
MPHPMIAAAMIATLIGAILICRFILTAAIDAIGPNVAMLIVLGCYILVCHIHRRERGY